MGAPLATPMTPLRIATATSGALLARIPTFSLTPSVGSPICSRDGGSTYAVEPVIFPGLAGQAWAADQIVVGTVAAQRAIWRVDGGEPLIETYSVVQVEERVRGLPVPELLVVEGGGTLDGCLQRSRFPLLNAGETLLLFLHRSDGRGSSDAPIYTINGDESGQRRIERDGNGVRWAVSGGPRLPLEQLLVESRQALTQPPPRELNPIFIVPLDRAPLAPVATPTR